MKVGVLSRFNLKHFNSLHPVLGYDKSIYFLLLINDSQSSFSDEVEHCLHVVTSHFQGLQGIW